MQAIVASTGDAAECMGLNEIGTLSTGKWADFVVYTGNPATAIADSHTIESVWIAGNTVPAGGN